MPIYDEHGAFITSELVTGSMKADGRSGDLQSMADAIRETLAPAPRGTLEEWLAEVSVIAPSRSDDEMTMAMKLDAYCKRLAEYPGDIVRDALLSKAWRFFPSWYELQQAIEPPHRERLAMLRACECQPEPTKEQEPEQTEPRVTAERASEIMEEIWFRPKRMDAGNE